MAEPRIIELYTRILELGHDYRNDAEYGVFYVIHKREIQNILSSTPKITERSVSPFLIAKSQHCGSDLETWSLGRAIVCYLILWKCVRKM
jgi:hypothetical protein